MHRIKFVAISSRDLLATNFMIFLRITDQLANSVQFKLMLMFVWKIGGESWDP